MRSRPAKTLAEQRLYAIMRRKAIAGIKADLALEAVARSEGIGATEAELDAAITRLARNYGYSVSDVRTILTDTGQLPTLVGDIIRAKALDFVVSQAEVTRYNFS